MISVKFVPKGTIDYISALVQTVAWRRPGDTPLSEPMMVILLTHIWVFRPQWVKALWCFLSGGCCTLLPCGSHCVWLGILCTWFHALSIFTFPGYARKFNHWVIKPGLYISRWKPLTVARLGDSRRQLRVCLYFSWRLSLAQVGDCRQQSPTVVFKVQQCWTFNAVASCCWHFPSNQRAATAFIRSRPMQTWSNLHSLLNI